MTVLQAPEPTAYSRAFADGARRGRAAWPLAFVFGVLCGVAGMGFYFVIVIV